MANERYPVKTAGGSEILPIADAVLYTDSMNASSASRCHVYMEFFSDAAGTVVTSPSAGVISAQASPMGSVWLDAGNYGTVNAADVKPTGAYTPPSFDGRVEKRAGDTFRHYRRTNGPDHFLEILAWDTQQAAPQAGFMMGQGR